MIKLRFTTLDGIKKTKSFKTLAGARKAAWKWVGKDADLGGYYAVSADGVVVMTIEGCSLQELFANEEPETFDPGVHYFMIKVDGQFIAKPFQFECDAQEHIYNNQLDNVTYDRPDGSIGVYTCEVVPMKDGQPVELKVVTPAATFSNDEIPF